MLARRDARIAHLHRLLRAEALVTHREMEVIRQSTRGDRRYGRRVRLLAEARAELASIIERGPREPPL